MPTTDTTPAPLTRPTASARARFAAACAAAAALRDPDVQWTTGTAADGGAEDAALCRADTAHYGLPVVTPATVGRYLVIAAMGRRFDAAGRVIGQRDRRRLALTAPTRRALRAVLATLDVRPDDFPLAANVLACVDLDTGRTFAVASERVTRLTLTAR